ncbi:hypothetical protein D0863_13912 [Hortaea werneckii]|uniref:WLM domain-containing protein n=1 Tax=Hortaea werneckii TaxID=91943 RepID=A0A3M7CNC9_HORWE|nr:hypothetical protein D0863_13912 [Hortaea werneckii]
MMPPHISRNRGRTKGGPSGVQRSYASQLKETEALFNSYEHLQGLPRGDAALTMLRKVASLVKPIMRKRGWKVQILAEFLPPEQNLLGLNINKGYKICIRLRYHNNPDLFLPTEQVVDTMLHELSHNVWGDHDSNFHRLWDELRDEQETLMRKGYTGEGFLSEGHRLGGGRYGAPPPHERNTINRGCASGRGDASKLAEQQGRTTFRTKAEEDDANDRAIAQALYELMEQEEEKKLKGTFSAAPADGGLAWHPESGLYDPKKESRPLPKNHPEQDNHPTEEEQMRWALEASTKPSPPSSAAPSTYALSPVSPLSPQNIDRTISAPPPHRQPPSSRPDPSRTQPNQPPPTAEKLSTKRARTSHDTATTSPHPAKPSTSPPPPPPIIDLSEPFNPDEWTCDICTCINPTQFLACDACGTERPTPSTTTTTTAAATATARTHQSPQRQRPPPKSSTLSAPVSACSSEGVDTRMQQQQRAAAGTRQTRRETETGIRTGQSLIGWNCDRCGSFMEHRWWTCSACGGIKGSS